MRYNFKKHSYASKVSYVRAALLEESVNSPRCWREIQTAQSKAGEATKCIIHIVWRKLLLIRVKKRIIFVLNYLVWLLLIPESCQLLSSLIEHKTDWGRAITVFLVGDKKTVISAAMAMADRPPPAEGLVYQHCQVRRGHMGTFPVSGWPVSEGRVVDVFKMLMPVLVNNRESILPSIGCGSLEQGGETGRRIHIHTALPVYSQLATHLDTILMQLVELFYLSKKMEL